MRSEVQHALIERVLRHVDARSVDMGEAARLPVTRYTDPDRFARERELFRSAPMPIAHTSALSKPGDFFTHDHGDRPLLATVDNDGKRHMFLNVCRHRGTRLEEAPCGQKKALTCPYHAWTYGLDGALMHVPHEEGFPSLNKTERGLRELPLTDKYGFLWTGSDVDAFLGSAIADDFASYGFENHVVHHPMSIARPLNWKLTIDIFLEAYHVKRVHQNSIYPVFFDNIALFEQHKPHMRNVFPKRTIRELASMPREQWSLRQHANVLYYLFPNTLVLVQPDHASVFHVFPRKIDETFITTYSLIPEAPSSEKAAKHWQKNIEILHGAVREDLAMGESIQRALSSGANEEFLLGRYEHSLDWFHTAIDRAVAVAPG